MTEKTFDQIRQQGDLEKLVRGYQLLIDAIYGEYEYNLTVSATPIFEGTKTRAIISQIGTSPMDKKLLIFNRNVRCFDSLEEFVKAILTLIEL